MTIRLNKEKVKEFSNLKIFLRFFSLLKLHKIFLIHLFQIFLPSVFFLICFVFALVLFLRFLHTHQLILFWDRQGKKNFFSYFIKSFLFPSKCQTSDETFKQIPLTNLPRVNVQANLLLFSVVMQLKLEFFPLLPSSAACQYNIAYPSDSFSWFTYLMQLLCLLLGLVIYTPHDRQESKI